MDTLGPVLGGHKTGVLTSHTQQGFMNEARKRSSFINKMAICPGKGRRLDTSIVFASKRGWHNEEFTEVAYLIMRHLTASLYYIHNYV